MLDILEKKLKGSKVPILFLIGIGLLVFGRSLSYPLLWWDDIANICQNPAFNQSFGEALKTIWSKPHLGMYIPATYSAWLAQAAIAAQISAINDSCSEFGPLFHCVNLLLHIANSCLVFLIVKKVLPKKSEMAAFVVGILFLIHPMQVEAVAWVTAQKDLLAVFFALLGILVGLDNISEAGFGKILGVTLFFSLSALAKPSCLLAPVILAYIAWKQEHASKKKIISVVLPSLLTAIPIAVVAKSLQATEMLRFSSPLWQRPIVMLSSFGFYIWKTIFPVGLVPDYARPIFALNVDPLIYWAIGLALICAGACFFIPRIRAGMLWAALALLPASGIVPFGFQETSTVADRFFYFSFAGIALAFVNLLSGTKIFAKILLCALPVLAVASFIQIGYWRSDESLFRRTLDLSPQSHIAGNNVGHALYEQKRYAEAIPILEEAIRVAPENMLARVSLARSFEKQEKFAEAEEIYRSSIHAGFEDAIIDNNLGSLLARKGDIATAIEFYKKASQLDPNYFEPRFNLGMMYQRLGNAPEAGRSFEEARKIRPEDPNLKALVDGK